MCGSRLREWLGLTDEAVWFRFFGKVLGVAQDGKLRLVGRLRSEKRRAEGRCLSIGDCIDQEEVQGLSRRGMPGNSWWSLASGRTWAVRPAWLSGRRPQGRDQGIGKESMFKFIEDCPRDEPEEKMIPFLVAEETEAQSWVWPQICSVCVWCTQSGSWAAVSAGPVCPLRLLALPSLSEVPVI